MTSYAVLLRGVNVGGRTLKMAEVREALAEGGFPAARTVLASGNVLLDSAADAAQVGPAVESILTERFGYRARVLVRSIQELAEIVADYPFDTDESSHHPYVVFCRSAAVLDDLREVLTAIDETERIAPGADVLYWELPRGRSLDTAVAKVLARARYKEDTTTRNLRTLRRLLP
ncbi:DUF1697 domain-containing protein [Ruania zhangjianzhongii]|uniref:DUF1697 domain-containing protein n=1 Tax=Ruania zhangjianzhongii TaxID=2603206 RepID=UPI0011C8F37F|nr:DUF1697 domain-containing protein [Ruania zhangjianzhongii]